MLEAGLVGSYLIHGERKFYFTNMVDMQAVSGQYLFFKFISLRGVKFIVTIVGFIACSVIMLYSQNGHKILQKRTRTMEETEKFLSTWIFDLEQKGTPPEESKIRVEAKLLFHQIKGNLEDKTEKEIHEKFWASNVWYANFKKRNKVQRVQLVLNDLNDQEYYGEVENVTRDTKFIYYVTIEDDVVGKNGLLYNEEYFLTSNFFMATSPPPPVTPLFMIIDQLIGIVS